MKRNRILTALREESGVTLMEMVVATFLISIASAIVIVMLNTAIGIMNDIESRAGGEAEANIIANNMAWEIRTGQKLAVDVPVLAATNANEITFYRMNDLTAVPVRFHYYLYGDKLMKGFLTAQADGPPWLFTGVENVSQAGQYVRNTSGSPMFKYYNDVGAQIYPASDTDRKLVRKVGISITCDIDTSLAPPPYTSNTEIRLRNQK